MTWVALASPRLIQRYGPMATEFPAERRGQEPAAQRGELGTMSGGSGRRTARWRRPPIRFFDYAMIFETRMAVIDVERSRRMRGDAGVVIPVQLGLD